MWSSLRVVGVVARKELIQTLRDPRMLPLLLVAPILQTVVFGFAVNLDLKDQPVAVVDSDRTEASRSLTDELRRADSFDVVGVLDDPDKAEALVMRGEAALVLQIPRGFGEDLQRGQAAVAVVVDGSDANTAVRASQELNQILAQRATSEQWGRLGAALAARGIPPERATPRIRLESRAWYNPQLRTAVFLVPGVLALVLAVITMVLTAMGLTREKEVGTLEQLMVSPLRPHELILGKVLPFVAFGLVDVALVSALAFLVFGVPLRGSLVAVFVVSGVYLLTTLGLGLFISTVSATQQQALLNAFFVLLPALMLSGYVFPVEHMPEPVQWLTTLNPLRYYITLMRGLMVKGAPLGAMLPSLAALAGLGLAVTVAASLRFRKTAR